MQLIDTSCDTWGEQDWALYQSTLGSYREKLSKVGIREKVNNLHAQFDSPFPILFYGNELAFRWFLNDKSIEYVYHIYNFGDKEYIDLKPKGCSFLINTDTLLTQNTRKLGVVIERAGKESYNWGIQHVLVEIDRSGREIIESQLNDCGSLDSRINIFLDNDLFFDTLTLLEKQAMKQNSPELCEKYWRACNEIRIALKNK